MWESVGEKESNETRNAIDRQEDIEMDLKEALKYRLESKSRALYGELEAVYKNFTIAENDQTGPREITPSEASIREEAASSLKNSEQRKRRKKKIPTAQFFEQLVSKMMRHQENFQRRFSEVIERLDEERREREEAWRNRESERFELAAEARAREKALTAGREAAIFSYLEIITGEKFRPPRFNSSESSSRVD